MLTNIRKRKNGQEGFTIIEVLIVLAIAGLILLIVFLAVPALQRNARNTQRKNDVAAISSAVADYIDNNGGTFPTAVSDSGANTLLVGTAAGANSESAKLGYYVTGKTGTYATADGNFFIIAVPTSQPSIAAGTGTPTSTNVTTESVTIVTGWNCNANNNGISTAASPRSAAILYATETGSGAALQCVEQ